MGATDNAGFNAKVQRNLGLDFVKKNSTNHCKDFNQFTAKCSDMLTSLLLLWQTLTMVS